MLYTFLNHAQVNNAESTTIKEKTAKVKEFASLTIALTNKASEHSKSKTGSA